MLRIVFLQILFYSFYMFYIGILFYDSYLIFYFIVEWGKFYVLFVVSRSVSLEWGSVQRGKAKQRLPIRQKRYFFFFHFRWH